MDKLSNLSKLKLEIQLKAKNGIDFILAAAITWLVIFLFWKFSANNSYDKSVLTFIFGAMLLPLALGFSKILKTNWKIAGNELQPLGLWLNFAQLIYFPFLVFILIKHPDYFIMAYAIITGAHLFPYAWFYDEIGCCRRYFCGCHDDCADGSAGKYLYRSVVYFGFFVSTGDLDFFSEQ